MEPWLIRIVHYLLAQSWQIAVLTLAVALAAFALRNRSAHVRYLLWLIVLAKALVPPLYSVPLAVLPERAPPVFVPAPPMGERMIAEPEPVSRASRPRIADRMPATRSAPSPVALIKPARYGTRAWPAVVWLTGAIALLSYYLANALRTQIWLQRRRVALPSESAGRIESFFTAHGIRRMPRVWLLERINQPFVWGLVRGSIYLPARLWHGHPGHDFLHGLEARATFQPSLLGHELSHVMRFDAMVNSLQVVAQTIFWFHPFVWWANRKIRAEREKCCDEMTIARLNARPEEYGEAIVETLAAQYEQARPIPSLAVAGQVKNIEERIKTMLKPGKKFYKCPSLPVATAVVFMALLTVPTAVVLTVKAEDHQRAEGAESGQIHIDPTNIRPSVNSSADEHDPKTAISGDDSNLYFASSKSGRIDVGKDSDIGQVSVSSLQVKPTKSLQKAAADGDLGQVKLNLSLGADVNAKDIRGNSALLYAAINGHEVVAELLIDKGAEIDATGGYYNWTPLHWAAYTGHTGVAKLLVTRGANVNAKCADDGTPLHEAAWHGHKDVIELLLESGVDPNARDNWSGDTALHRVAAGGYADATKVFIAKGVDTRVKNMAGQTALYKAASAGNKKVASLLLGKESSAQLAALRGDLLGVQHLMEQGFDVNARDEQLRWTLLHWAVCSDNEDVAAFLLSRGADVNARGEFDDPPLLYAAATARKDLVGLLLTRGAEVDARDKFGTAAIHNAARWGHRDVVALLLAHGADVNTRKENGFTPLHLSARDGHREVVQFLLESSADVNTKSDIDKTALHEAVRKGRTNIADLLLASGADVNARERGSGYTPLHRAALSGRSAITDMLLSRGANTEAENRTGATPLHVAVTHNRSEVVKRLLFKGANVNATDHSGDTPLHRAVSNRNKEMVDLLLAQGADVNTRNGDGQTPLSLARSATCSEIVKLLVKHSNDE